MKYKSYIPPWWIVLSLLISFSSLAQNKIVGYEYFFNNATGLQYVPITPTSSFTLDRDIDISSLTNTVNIFHLHFKDENGLWSPTLSKMFVVPPTIPASTDRKIVGYEYFFNNDGSGGQYFPISPTDTYNLVEDIDISSLTNTVNVFHLRFKDSDGFWSPALSKMFIIPPQIPAGTDHKIVGFEYYFNNDGASRQYTSISPTDAYSLVTDLDVSSLTKTVNIINVRFKDNAGLWSPVISKMFMIPPHVEAPVDRQIVGYEYFLNNDTNNRHYTAVSPQDSFTLLTDIDVNSLNRTVNTIYFRYKDNTGFWSPTISKLFMIPPQPVTYSDTKITSYEYWFDNDRSNLRTIDVDPDVVSLNVTELDMNHIWRGEHRIHTRYKDTKGEYSVIQTDTITKISRPLALFEVDQTEICINNDVSFTDNGSIDYDTYVWDFDDGTTTTDHDVVHTFTAAGTYDVTLTVTDTNTGVSNIKHQTISVNNYPANTVSTSHTFPACYGETITLTADASGMGYLWSNGATTQSIDVTSAGTYSVQIWNLSGAGCAVTSDDIVVSFYNEIDNAVTSSHTFPACYGETVTLTANASGMNYLWSTGETTQSIDVITAGNYSVQITNPTTNCVVNSDVIAVSFNTEIDNSVSSSHTFPACFGETITLTANESGMNYLWSTGETTQSIDVTTAGNYSVQITNPTTNCSVTSDIIAVSFYAEIDNSVTSSHTFPACYGETVTLTANKSGMNYLWSTGETTQSIDVTAAGNYSVQITNPTTNCSVTSDIIAVSFNAEIDNAVSSSHTFPACFGETITLTANENNMYYLWSTGEVSQSITVNSAGNYSVQITNPSTLCVVNSDTIAVSFNAEIDNSITSSHTMPACFGETITLTANQNFANYLWSTGETTQSIEVTSAGNYSVQITDAVTGCSVNSDDFAVSFNAQIDNSVSSSHTFPACFGETVTLTANQIGASYLWSTGETTQSIDITTPGNYSVQITNPATNCAVTSDIIAVSFNAEIDNSVSSSHTFPACFGETITLTANATGMNYLWSTGETTQSIDVSTGGNYSVQITNPTTNCIVNSDIIAVSFNAEIDNSITSSHTMPACFGETITLTANQNFANYLWSTGETTQSIEVTSTGNYSVQITDVATGCVVNSDDFVVSFNAQINNSVSSSHTFPACFGETVTLTANQIGASYLWSTGETTQSIDITTAGNYSVQITNPATNCTITSDEIVVSYHDEIDNTVTFNASPTELVANQSGATYQWIDCNNNNQPITGETGQHFAPTEIGYYAVIITMNGCSVTSTCMHITNVSVEENGLTDLINIYPNPVSDIIHFESEANLLITIISLEGKIISRHQLINKSSYLNVSDLTTGVYIARIEIISGENKGKTFTTRFIKE